MDWRFLLFTEPSQIASHWLTYQWKLHWAWKWALPASWGATAMKRPECMVKSLARKGSCCLETGTYKLSLQRLNHDYYWIQHILKGIQGGYQKLDTRSVLWEKYDKTSLQNVGCFLAKFFFFSFLSLSWWNKMAEDGWRVGGHGVHYSLWMHQEYTFRHKCACRTSAESRHEYLNTREENIDPCKFQ